RNFVPANFSRRSASVRSSAESPPAFMFQYRPIVAPSSVASRDAGFTECSTVRATGFKISSRAMVALLVYSLAAHDGTPARDVLRDRLLELRLQLLPVLHALDVAGEARVTRHPGEPEGRDQTLPEPVVGARDEHPLAVTAAEVPVRRERRVGRAERLGDGAGE